MGATRTGAARQIPGPAPPDGNRRFGFAIVFVLLMGVAALPLPTGAAVLDPVVSVINGIVRHEWVSRHHAFW